MAIYDLGTASLAENGEVTGVGTTWKAPLTLIRVGATIIFKTSPLKIYTISEIISDTQINVYNPNSETVPSGTGYAILAHDGITVQGLAQDVAETLRYYQSKETSIEGLLQFIGQETFDWPRFEQLATQSTTGAAEALASQIAAAESASTAVGASNNAQNSYNRTVAAINAAGNTAAVAYFAEHGIGSTTTPLLTSLDWQTMQFYSGGSYQCRIDNMVNIPEDLSSMFPATNTTICIDVLATRGINGSNVVRISPSTTSNAVFRVAEITFTGATGSRNFYVRELLSVPGGDASSGGSSALRVRGLLDVYSKSETFQKSLNLSDVANKSLARSNLGLSSVDSISLIGSASYSDIRSYTGTNSRIQCYGRNSAFDHSYGIFFLDASDTTSEDNDGTILVDALGRRWKRSYAGPVDVRWFGVKADGTTDDTAAANKALGTLQYVRFPAGTIIISAPLIFGTQIVEGVGTYPNGKYGTIIQCTGDHAAFEHSSVGYQPGGEIKGFWINYQAGKPTSTTGRSKGINFGTSDTSVDPLTGGVTCFTIENVIVRGAYYGFYDVTSAYLMEYRNCWAWDCIQGFVKDYGTTVKYSTCYSLDCYASWKLRYCHVPTFVNCAYDGTDIFGDLVPFYAEQCPGLTVTGMQHESSKISVSGRSDFTLVNCNSAKIIGFSIPSWTNSAGAGGEAYLFRFTNSNVDISGINLSGFVSGGSSDVSSTGANSYTILANTGSKVNVTASNLPLISGSPFSYTFSASADSRIDYSSNCTFTGLINGLVFVNGLSQPAYIDYNVTLQPGAMSFLGTVSVPNVKYGDFIHIDVSSGLSGIDIFASRAGGGVGSVNVFMVNHNTSALSVSGQAVVRFMRP